MNAVAICSYHGGALHVLCPEMGTVTHTAEPFPSGIPMQEHRCVLEAFENPETPNVCLLNYIHTCLSLR
jgi:hypothetical protein